MVQPHNPEIPPLKGWDDFFHLSQAGCRHFLAQSLPGLLLLTFSKFLDGEVKNFYLEKSGEGFTLIKFQVLALQQDTFSPPSPLRSS